MQARVPVCVPVLEYVYFCSSGDQVSFFVAGPERRRHSGDPSLRGLGRYWGLLLPPLPNPRPPARVLLTLIIVLYSVLLFLLHPVSFPALFCGRVAAGPELQFAARL